MLTPAELERIPIEIQKLMLDLSMRIMEDAVERVSMIDSISRTADNELFRLNNIGVSSATIRKAIKNTLQKTDAEIDMIYDGIIKEGYTRDETLYNAVGKPFTRYEDNGQLQQLIEAVKRQTKDEIRNITQTTAYRLNGPGGLYVNTADYLKSKLDTAIMEITSGAFDYNKSMLNMIKEMTKSGVRVVEYESGWHNRIDVAARRAVMTGVTQVTGKINEMNAETLETKFFEVSWHSTARPSHQLFQGRVFYWDKENPLDSITVDGVHYKAFIPVTEYGTGPGLCGWNCYHSFYAFIPGISTRLYTDEQLDEMHRKENEKKEYKGKLYTTYEATQRQRELETIMRKYRQDIKLGQSAGLPEDTIALDQSMYQGTMKEYVDFSKKMGLPQQRERINQDGIKRV